VCPQEAHRPVVSVDVPGHGCNCNVFQDGGWGMVIGELYVVIPVICISDMSGHGCSVT